jgi:hypothetical protein
VPSLDKVVTTIIVFWDIIHRPVFLFKTQRFGDWTLPTSSGWGPSIELVPISEHQEQRKIGYEYINKTQHKPSAAVKTIVTKLYLHETSHVWLFII